MDEESLKEKLRRIEALFEGATTEGEREAAANARERVQARLKEMAGAAPPTEWKFSLPDMWSRKLFVALARRYGFEPFRYTGQRHTTVMIKATQTVVDGVLWPEYLQLEKVLRTYLDDVTSRVIAQVVHENASEAAEVAAPKLLGPSPQGRE